MEALELDIRRFLTPSKESGYGYGYGYGDGSGSGDGYGSGYGSGSGSGSGDGYGYGDIISFNGHKVHDVDGMPTLIYHVRGDYAKGAILNGDLTLKPCFVARFGDFYGHGGTIHEAFEASKDKAMQEMPVEERIDLFVREHPDLDKEYGDLFKWHHILTGSCEFGRRQWCEQHGYKPTDSITIRTFLDKTRDDYGRDVIAQVRKRYGLN